MGGLVAGSGLVAGRFVPLASRRPDKLSLCSASYAYALYSTSLPPRTYSPQTSSFATPIHVNTFPKKRIPSFFPSLPTLRLLGTSCSEDFEHIEKGQHHPQKGEASDESEEESNDEMEGEASDESEEESNDEMDDETADELEEETTDKWDAGSNIEWKEESDDEWEAEAVSEAEAQMGDGGDGGGILLHDLSWGARALSIAHEVLLQFGEDMKLFSFKAKPSGYIFLRLDKLSDKYGCPSIGEIENYHREYKKRLDELGAQGEIPDELAIEVSSPGALRLLKVPDDLNRFKELPMTVTYEESKGRGTMERVGHFMVESMDSETERCTWKLADVVENRDGSKKGRPLSRDRRALRLELPYEACKKVTLYVGDH